MTFETRQISGAPDVMAPDGSESSVSFGFQYDGVVSSCASFSGRIAVARSRLERPATSWPVAS